MTCLRTRRGFLVPLCPPELIIALTGPSCEVRRSENSSPGETERGHTKPVPFMLTTKPDTQKAGEVAHGGEAGRGSPFTLTSHHISTPSRSRSRRSGGGGEDLSGEVPLAFTSTAAPAPKKGG